MKNLFFLSIVGALFILPLSFTSNHTAGGCKLEFAILKKVDTAYISEIHFCDYGAYSFAKDILREHKDSISQRDLTDLKYELVLVSNGVYVRGHTEEPSRRQLEKTRTQMREVLEKEFNVVIDVKSSR